jgi:hypothetical protein
MSLSDAAIQNLKRLWVSPQPNHVKLAITMSNDALLIHEHLMPECILAKEFHPDLTTRLDIEDFLNKMVYSIELRAWREKVKFFQPPHQVFLYKKYVKERELFESHLLQQPHLYEKYKETAIHCSYSWGREDKLKVGLQLFEKILEKEPEEGDNYFFLGRCHHYIYMVNHDYGATKAIKAYRKAMRNKTSYRGQIKKELESLIH